METAPARRGRAFRVRRGQGLKVINTHGTQVVDAWALALSDLEEHMSMAHTRAQLSSLRLEVGDELWSDLRRPILTLAEDTSPGVHDLLFPACDARRYELLGHSGYHENCCDNFRAALDAEGYRPPRTVPCPLNLFMNARRSDEGALELVPPVGSPGDHVVLRAERDVLVVLSACPQDMVPINGPMMRPADVHVELVA